MNDRLLAAIADELATELRGRSFGKVWQLAPDSLAVDFRGGEPRTLFVSVNPVAPRLHLTSRKVRDLEKRSVQPSNFALALRKRLAGAPLVSIKKDACERACGKRSSGGTSWSATSKMICSRMATPTSTSARAICSSRILRTPSVAA